MEIPRQRSHLSRGGPTLQPSFSDLSEKSPRRTSRAGKHWCRTVADRPQEAEYPDDLLDIEEFVGTAERIYEKAKIKGET
eukprot:9290005-Pyramimonas_sp.AAC.1